MGPVPINFSKQRKFVLAKDAKAPGKKGEAEGTEIRKLNAPLRQLERRPHEMRALFRTLVLVCKLSEKQLPAAFEMLKSSSLLPRQIYVHDALLTRWAQFDPRKAIEHTKEVRLHAGRITALEGIMNEWVVHYPEAALAAMPNLEMDLHQIKRWDPS